MTAALAAPPTARDLARSPAALKKLSPTAIRAFRDIAAHWGLAPLEQRILLGIVPQSTYTKYMREPKSATLSYDTLQRISHLYGIFKAINVLLPDERLADAWIAQPNDHPLFKGASPKDVMLDGTLESIAAVRTYLDAERGW
jgi:uncharacterized protein (DUF2384 family)